MPVSSTGYVIRLQNFRPACRNACTPACRHATLLTLNETGFVTVAVTLDYFSLFADDVAVMKDCLNKEG